MKIAIFTETFLPQINGVVRTIEKIIRHLEEHGHEVLLFAIGEGDDYYSNTRVVRLEGVPFNMYKELYIVKPEDKWLKKLIEHDLTQTPIALLQSLVPAKHSLVEQELLEFKPDLIHLATPVTLGAIGIFYSDLYKIPCLATFHTDLAAYAPMYQVPYMEEIINQVTKLIYSRAARVLAPSQSSKHQLENVGLKDVGVFGRGVDSVLFKPEKRNKKALLKYGLSESRITLVYVGRLADEKSIPELVQAFNSLVENHEIQLLMVGDGPIKATLEKSLEISDGHYAFTGIKKGEELAELYASSDIFAFPSRTETFGQVVQEAMASGLPAVGYDSPGVRDLIKNDETGLLVVNKDEVEFKEALKKLIDSEELRLKFGKNARELAEANSWSAILDSLIDEYKNLVIQLTSDARN
jgi:glycosyltransferase involved in cell wall biosynthesis